MVYDIIFIIMIIIFIKKYRNSVVLKNSDNIMSTDNTLKIKGFLSVIIILHHLSLSTNIGSLFKVFYILGIISVGVFFFISGYGLMSQYMNKDDYLDTFLQKRIPKLLFPYMTAIVLYTVVYNLMGMQKNIFSILQSLLNGNPIVCFSWYVIATLVFYVMFYILALLLQNRYNYIVGSVVFCMILYYMICRILDYGSWWYNSCLTFAVGMLWAIYEDKLKTKLFCNVLKAVGYSLLGIFCSLVGLGITYCISPYSVSQIIETPELGNQIISKPFPILCIQFITIFTCIIILLAFKKKPPSSPIWNYIGGISYEIYLSHGIVMYLLRNNYFFVISDFIYICLVLFGTFLIAKIMERLNTVIWNSCIILPK